MPIKGKLKAYTESPFMNISGLSLIKFVRTQTSKSFIVNCKRHKKIRKMSTTTLVFLLSAISFLTKINKQTNHLVCSILRANIHVMNLHRIKYKLHATKRLIKEQEPRNHNEHVLQQNDQASYKPRWKRTKRRWKNRKRSHNLY